jgi:NAD(P)-dependent dehydrogenase (short-subunit alcohol dehydrogenase family)
MKKLGGKVILVAGGGGLGNVLARRYAQEGACVVLGHKYLDAAHAVAKEIEAEGGTISAVHLDGTDERTMVAAVAIATEKYGGLDGLHANFAVLSQAMADTDVIDTPLDVVDITMRVNLLGYFLCTRYALPAIIARGGGSVVYTSSIGAHTAEQTQVAYAMSKAAGHALMRHVAGKYGAQGVRANSIAPGLIKHEKWASLPAETVAYLEKMALDRAAIKSGVATPDHIAALGALLMSDDGKFITGQVLSVDGGMTMRP